MALDELVSKKSKFKKAEADESDTISPKKHVQAPTLEQQVNRLIDERFSDFDKYQMFEYLIEGKSCYSRLEELKKKFKRVHESKTDELRRMYASSQKSESKLKVSVTPQIKNMAVRPELTTALTKASANSNSAKNLKSLYTLLNTGFVCNAKEFAVLCNSIVALNPDASQADCLHMFTLYKYFVNSGCKDEHPTVFVSMEPKFDDICASTYRWALHKGEAPSQWFSNNSEYCSHFVPMEKINALLAIPRGDSFLPHKDTVYEVCESSRLGSAMFGAVKSKLMVDAFLAEVERAAKQFVLDDEQEFQNIQDWKDAQTQGSQSIAATMPEVLKERFTTTCYYRGISFKRNAASLRDVVLAHFEVICKSLSAGRPGGIDLLSFEASTLGAPANPEVPSIVPNNYIKDAKCGRTTANQLATKANSSTSSDFDALYQKHEKTLVQVDYTFMDIEANILKALKGAAAITFMEEKMKNLLPTAAKPAELPNVIASFEQLLTCDLYKFMEADAQGRVDALLELLLQVRDGVLSAQRFSICTGFAKELRDSIPHTFKWTDDKDVKHEGASGLKKLSNFVLTCNLISPEHKAQLKSYRLWLDAETLEKINAKVKFNENSAVVPVVTSRKKKASDNHGSASAKKGKSTKSELDNAKETVANYFNFD